MDRSFDYHFVRASSSKPGFCRNGFFTFYVDGKTSKTVRNVNFAPPILKFFRLMTLKNLIYPRNSAINNCIAAQCAIYKMEIKYRLYPGWCVLGLVLKFRRPACPKFQHVETRGKIVEKCHAAVVPWSHLNPPACMYALVGSKENVCVVRSIEGFTRIIRRARKIRSI